MRPRSTSPWVAIVACACLLLAACGAAEGDEVTAGAESVSRSVGEVESFELETTPPTIDDAGETSPASDPAPPQDLTASSSTAPPTTEAATDESSTVAPPVDDEAVEQPGDAPIEEAELIPESSTTEAPTTTQAPTTTAAPTTTQAPTTTAAPTTTQAPTTTTAPEPALDPNSPLNGTFATVGGQSIDLRDLQGQDVVLWFWAPW